MKVSIKCGFVLALFCCLSSFRMQAQTNVFKPPVFYNYKGLVVFCKGNFGTYNYPEKDDSIAVAVIDSSKIIFKIFRPYTNVAYRSTDIDFAKLKLVKRKEYGDIVSIEKTILTGNYDMKFSTDDGSNASSVYTISLTHYGAGDNADFTIYGEHDGLRVDDVLVAHLTKVK